MELSISPKKAAYFLGTIIAVLIAANIAGLVANYLLDTDSYAFDFFNLAKEHNFPTYFSVFQLLLCSLVLALVARMRKKMNAGDYWYWFGLSGIFLFLSLDESLMIHEIVAIKVREAFDTTGAFYFAWIIPYALLVLGVGFIYLRFVLRLPAKVKRLVFLSALIFVSGALGLEAVESFYFTSTGEKDLVFYMLASLEESMEMLGILLFLYALLYHIDRELGGVALTISSGTEAGISSKNALTNNHQFWVQNNRKAVQKPQTSASETRPAMNQRRV